MTKPDVSIIIVCMNNYSQLKDCLDSIKKFTNSVSYETLLVAYFFSDENLNQLYREYPWVKVIISNEIRGFSANNNLALRQAKGKYCFVLNDDTYFNMPVIDQLVNTIENNDEITLVSPQILHPDGEIQYSGIPPRTWIDWIKIMFKLKRNKKNKYVQYKGIFKTYNILGAAFLIKTDVFKKLGFFDERYFFGPEDIALSMLMNKNGYSCYVNADIKLFHIGGNTGGEKSPTVCATRPAWRKGSAIMYSEGKRNHYYILCLLIWINSASLSLWWAIKMIGGNKSALYSFIANINVCRSIFSKGSTTDIFKRFYKKNK